MKGAACDTAISYNKQLLLGIAVGSKRYIPSVVLDRSPLDPQKSAPANWATIEGYPVPENLSYSANLRGNDGYMLGDTNWFPGIGKIDGIKQTSNGVPAKFELSQNYPNLFNPTTLINYSLPKSSFISLKVYNILGQEVATLCEGFQKVGSYKADFDASKLASAVYLYRLQSNGFSQTKKMILIK